MKIVSKLVEINKKEPLTTEYIESELKKRNITPLRWAIVHVIDKIYKISVAILSD